MMDETMDERALELSGQLGEGTASMSSVVQKAMVRILGPLAARLVDLEEKTENHGTSIAGLQQLGDATTARLEQHTGQLGKLSFDLGKTSENVQKAFDQLQESGDKHAALEAEHDNTRSLANHLDAGAKAGQASLSDLQRALEDVDSRARQTQNLMSETNVAHLNINDRLSEMRNRMEGLNERHTEMIKALQDCRREEENVRQALKRLTSGYDQFKRESERSFTRLDERSKTLEASVVDLNHLCEGSSRMHKTVRNDLTQFKNQLDNLFGARQQVDSNSAKDMVGPRDLQGRLGKLEEQVVKLDRAMAADKTQTMNIIQGMGDNVTKQGQELHQNRQDLDALEKAICLADQRLDRGDKKDAELTNRCDNIKENLTKCDSDLRVYITQVQKDMDAKLNEHGAELSKTNSGLNQTGQKLEATNIDVNALHSELASTNGAVHKLSVSLDLAHEYFQGLTKGFHDTHKRVVSGADSMLPPRGAVGGRPASQGAYGGGGGTLPVIHTPRPMSS
mmetsp:Transcript_26814/g.56811  ORF Transcript_26814/g.56811 Transcript_26814/m.56811 type:complete len:508 (-) Transcript_26814:78-1601(-)